MITRLRCTTTALIATIAAATGVLVVQQRANHRLQAVQHQACTAIDEKPGVHAWLRDHHHHQEHQARHHRP